MIDRFARDVAEAAAAGVEPGGRSGHTCTLVGSQHILVVGQRQTELYILYILYIISYILVTIILTVGLGTPLVSA